MKKIIRFMKKSCFVVFDLVLGILITVFAIRYLKSNRVTPGFLVYLFAIIFSMSFTFTVTYVKARTTLERILAVTLMGALSYFEGCFLGWLLSGWYFILKIFGWVFKFKLVKMLVLLAVVLLVIIICYGIYEKIKFKKIQERRKKKKNP